MSEVLEKIDQGEYGAGKHQEKYGEKMSVVVIPAPSHYLMQRVDVSCAREQLAAREIDPQRERTHVVKEVYVMIYV